MDDYEFCLISNLVLMALFAKLATPTEKRSELWAIAAKGYYQTLETNPDAKANLRDSVEKLKEALALVKEQT